MGATALLLVLGPAGCHAYWNFLLKRAGGSHAFVAVSKASEAVIFLPAFAALVLRAPAGTFDGAGRAVLGYVAVGTALVLATCATLAAAYRHGDFSFAYPIARGGALVFLPAFGGLTFGGLTFGERVGPLGWAAVAAITLGVVAMQLPALSRAGVRAFGAAARGPATGYALLMALVLALGTVWDKLAVRAVPLFAYFYGYTAAAGACYLAWVVRREGWPRSNQRGGSTYVVGLRRLSVAAGVALGVRFLGERVGAPRRLGVGLVLAGALLTALGR